MATFGVIAEGPSDQQVIENVLIGYFRKPDDEPVINPIQPPNPSAPGGWTRVFDSLRRGDAEGALQFNDYLVIQIDTDVQEETGFGVPRQEKGKNLTIPQRVERVSARLASCIDAAFYEANLHRILFAVTVETIECWLLPLLFDDNKAKKTTGCLDAANRQLRKLRRDGLAAGDGTKFPTAYDKASREYLKRKRLMEVRDRNPSLKLFIDQLAALEGRLAAAQATDDTSPEDEKPPDGQGSSDVSASTPDDPPS